MWAREQDNKILNILKHAQQNVPYYNELFSDDSIERITYEEFKKIPLMDKKTIRKRYENLLTQDINIRDIIYEYTSGSTGIPMRIPRTKLDRVRTSLPLIRQRKKWLGEMPNMRKSASYSHRVSDVASAMAEGWLGLWLRELTDENLKAQYQKILEFKPQILAGPPQALYMLAQWIIKNNLNMKKANIGLVECRSEYLFEGQRKLCEKAFKCPVINMYGCHEVWGIAYECSERNLHIMEDSVFLEILDENGELVENEDAGEVIVTGLCSHTMPIIRYRLGDRAIIHRSSCKCGESTPRIELLGCRCTEWIQTPKGRVSTTVLQPLIAKFSQPQYDNIAQFQLVQRDIEKFEFTVETINDISFQFKDMVQEEINKALGYSVEVIIIKNGQFKCNPNSAKLSWFYSDLN